MEEQTVRGRSEVSQRAVEVRWCSGPSLTVPSVLQRCPLPDVLTAERDAVSGPVRTHGVTFRTTFMSVFPQREVKKVKVCLQNRVV